jgi:hypothetical protein
MRSPYLWLTLSPESRCGSLGSLAASVPHHLSEIKLARFSCLRLRGYHQIYGDRQKAHALSDSKMVE